MEALILIFGEMIFAILAPFVAAVVDLIGVILAAIFSFIPGRRQERRVGSGAAKKMLIAFLAVGALIFAMLFVVNTFYFADSVRLVFDALERRSGIETRCSEINGSVFSGKISLDECAVARAGHASADFQLELDSVDIDLQISSLLGTAEVQTAQIAGLRGLVRRHEPAEQVDGGVEKPRRAFVIQDLTIEGVDVTLSGFNKDGGVFELPVQVNSATSAPLRSRLALFDVLFRSNATGAIAGAEFEIKTAGDSGGRQTVWRASDVPVASFGAMMGGVLSWFSDGVVDVYVEDRWRRGDRLEIDMDWRLGLRDVEVKAPDSAGAMTRLATGPIVAYVNRHDGDFPFEFQLTLNEDQFAYKSSLAAAGLWTVVGESLNNVLTELGIEMPESAEQTGEQLKQGARSLLDRLRKPPEEEDQ